MAEIERMMRQMDVKEKDEELAYMVLVEGPNYREIWPSSEEEEEEEELEEEEEEELEEEEEGPESDDMIEYEDNRSHQMEEEQSKSHASDVPLQLHDPKKTGSELTCEMFSYLKILESKGASKNEIVEAESKLHALLSSLTPGHEDTLEAALNDKNEIEGDMELLRSKLQQRSDSNDVGSCLKKFLSSALYWRWFQQREQRRLQKCASEGLKQFNGKQQTKFVVNKSTTFKEKWYYGDRATYLHLNFTATDHDSKETCTFFAEAVGKCAKEAAVKVCVKVEFGAKTSCWFCVSSFGIFHPTDVDLAEPEPNSEWIFVD